MLEVDDLVQVAHWSIVRSLVDQLLEGGASTRPISSDVLLVGVGEAALVLRVNLLPQLVDVLVLLELIPSRCLSSVELLVEAPPHFVSDGLLLSDRHVGQWVVGWFHVLGLHIDCEKSHGIVTANHLHGIDLPADLLELRRQQSSQMAGNEERRAELLGGGLQPCSHVDVWRQVTRIDLEL